MTIKSEVDDDLPWDPIWAYVLGEGEEDAKRGVFRRQKKTAAEEDGIMSYIKDVLPTTESRDEKIPHDRSDVKDSKEETKKSGFAWRRSSKNGGSDVDDVWEWQISLGNSYDEVAPATSSRTDNLSPLRDGPPLKDRRNSLFRRNDTESLPSKDASEAARRTQSGQRRAKSNDSWEWGLSTGSEYDEKVSSTIPTSKDSSQVKPRRASTFSSAFRKKNDNDSWDWQLSNGKKEKRSFVKRFSSSKEVDSWDFLAATSQDKGPRRVRFARASSKDDVDWIDTKEVVAQLERSQTSLFDWVGINPSYEEDETAQKVVRRNSEPSREKSQKRDVASFSESGDLFAGLFSWDGSSDDEDESSFQSSTDESSAGTLGEETGSDDDSKSQPTIVSDTSQSLHRETNENDRSQLLRQEMNEVRLSFQPLPYGETSTSQLPKIDEETSSTESQRVRPRDLTVPNAGTNPNPRVNEELPADENDDSDKKEWGSIEQSRSAGLGMCCSVKNLSSEQLKWTKESGIPFHELSQEEQLRLFPKNRAVPDADQYAPSSLHADRHLSSKPSANLLLPIASPLSLFEYEYNTGRNMFVSYNDFGDSSLTVLRAPSPDNKYSEKIFTEPEMLVMVEASTVSSTDCVIRQGHWWGSEVVPLPNTPGVDVVGRIYRVDTETSKKYGWKVGDRIVSLVKWGGNARYLSLDPSHAVSAPETIDPAMAVCLAETYLTAFQVLHMGQAMDLRYCDGSMSGKCILLRGLSVSSMGHAIAQLAANADALSVFAVAKEKHFNYLSSLGITPLNNDGKDWLKKMAGKIDLIISCDGDVVSIPYKLLKGNGSVISLKNVGSVKSTNVPKLKNGLMFRGRLSRIPRTRVSSYDVYEQWDKDLELCKRDLMHLVQLLANKKIEPTILDRIALNKVADAQDLIRSKRLSGFVVCEPWLVGKSRTICL